MTIANNGTTASVSVRTQVTVNRGNYQSEVASVGFSIEVDLDGQSFEDVLLELQGLSDRMTIASQDQAAAAVGLRTDADGIDFGSAPAPAVAAPAAAPAQSSQGGTGGGGSGGDFAPPKVANEEKTQLIIAGRAYYDNRPFKVAGRYQPGAADFRAVDQSAAPDGEKQLWLFEKGSTTKVDATWALLEAAGVEA